MKRISNSTYLSGLPFGFLLSLSLILSPTFLYAREIATEDVRIAVETWVRHVTADAKPDALIDRMEPYIIHGETRAYIAHLRDNGFCLCGANDLVLPVYFYNPHEDYDPQNPELQFILWEISSRTENLSNYEKANDPRIKYYRDELNQRALFWRDLIAGRTPAKQKEREERDGPNRMELPLTSIWDQGPPYNNLCPLGDGGRTVVGCGATAAAQVMRYWTWPPSGEGSHSYTWDGDDSCGASVGGKVLSATFSDTYDWQNMPDNCQWGCTVAERNALAELNYEVGVALEMDYGVCVSLCFTDAIAAALENHFHYDIDADYSELDTEGTTEEIQWLRPVVFRGEDAAGNGHFWVVMGYDKGTDPDRQFLMLMGWGDAPGWYTRDSVPHGLTIDQSYIFRIAPEDVVRFVGASDAGDGTPNNPYENIEEALAEAPNGATLIFKAGSDNRFSLPTLLIDRPFFLKGKNITIREESY